jgi:Tol biopolymer transport system component
LANVVAADSGTSDVWLFDTQRATETRFTFDPAMDSDAIFSPDGKSVIYYSARQPPGLYRKSSSGAGEETLLAATGTQTYPRDWTRDGRMIEFDKGNRPATTMWFLPMDGGTAGKPFAFAPGPYYHAQGHFSPDGHWLAYVSGESGRDEIFVQDFPPAGTKIQVSSSGGTEPRWRADGRELYYIARDGQMTAVGVEGGKELRLGAAKPLFDTHFAASALSFPMRRYGVAPAGDRFFINVPVGQRVPPITVVTNWMSRLSH